MTLASFHRSSQLTFIAAATDVNIIVDLEASGRDVGHTLESSEGLIHHQPAVDNKKSVDSKRSQIVGTVLSATSDDDEEQLEFDCSVL